MQDFFHYFFIAFLPKLWTLLGAGALFGIDEIARHWMPSLNKKLDFIHERNRRFITILALFIGVFFAGFLAWRDELEARIQIEQVGQTSPFHWAILTDKESADLRRYLRDLPPQTISILCTGSFCDDFAQSLRKALRPLNWRLNCCSAPLLGGGDFEPGIHIWSSGDEFKAIRDAIERATNGKVQIDRAENPGTGAAEFPIQILIGPKI